jgi:hypothetical protein
MLSPSTGKIHPINRSGPSCGYDEQLHQRGTPMPIVPSSGIAYDRSARAEAAQVWLFRHRVKLTGKQCAAYWLGCH